MDKSDRLPSYFRGGGYSSNFLTEGGMPVTMSRLNLVKGVGPVLQIAEGVTATLPDAVHDKLDKRTNETWPTTWFVPRFTGTGPFKDVYSVMAAWGANHGAVCYGIYAEASSAQTSSPWPASCRFSKRRIPVCMHNVPAEAVYRPSYWNAFGMVSAARPQGRAIQPIPIGTRREAGYEEGSDYRACEALGPMYK